MREAKWKQRQMVRDAATTKELPARGIKEQPSPTASRAAWLCWHLGFGAVKPLLRSVNVFWFKSLVSGTLIWSHRRQMKGNTAERQITRLRTAIPNPDVHYVWPWHVASQGPQLPYVELWWGPFYSSWSVNQGFRFAILPTSGQWVGQ